MKDQINTIREALQIEVTACQYEHHPVPDYIAKALTAIDQIEAAVGEPVAMLHDDGYWTPMKTESGRALNDRLMRAGSLSIDVYAAPVAQQTLLSEAINRINDMLKDDDGQAHKEARKFVDRIAQQPPERAQTLVEAFNDCDATHAGDLGYRSKQPQAEAVDWKAQYEHQKRRAERWIAKYEADIGPLEKAGPVAQQPQEIEVQCPVCNHKFYEWPNDKQPQAEAVPAVDRVYEAAKRLVDHADFQLGGVLSAKSKARDIPSNAASKVKARHLASLRDALAKTPHQAEAVPTIYVSRGQLENLKPDPEDETGTYLPVRKTPKGKFTHPLFAAPQQAEAVPQREAFEVEFAKLGYQWSDSNKDKAFLGWSLAVERAPQQAEAVPPTRAEAAAEILQYQLGWTYHDGEWIEDKAATETLRQQAEAVPPGYVADKSFRWDGEKQQHIPLLVIEFEPVPANGPCDAKGWKDRDQVAQMFDAALAQQKGHNVNS